MVKWKSWSTTIFEVWAEKESSEWEIWGEWQEKERNGERVISKKSDKFNQGVVKWNREISLRN